MKAWGQTILSNSNVQNTLISGVFSMLNKIKMHILQNKPPQKEEINIVFVCILP